MDGGLGSSSQTSNTHQGQNDSMMLDVHPDNLRGRLDAVDEEGYDEEMDDRRYLDAMFEKLNVVEDRNVTTNQSSPHEEECKPAATQSSTRTNKVLTTSERVANQGYGILKGCDATVLDTLEETDMTGVAALPTQQIQDRRTEEDAVRLSPLRGSYSIDLSEHNEMFGRIGYSMEHLTHGIVHLVQATDIVDNFECLSRSLYRRSTGLHGGSRVR